MSRISVILPTYNRANLIGETLKALLNQSRLPDEIIVVDDGSTDNTAEVVHAVDPKIRLIRQENAGPAVARNRGLAEARGEFIQFFDSDDIPASNKLEVQLRALEASGADIAYCPWVKAHLMNGVAECEPFVIQQLPLPEKLRPLGAFVRGWVTVFQTCLFRRSLLERAGGIYDTRLMPTEDSEYLSRMLMANAKLVHTPETLVLYRLHESHQISGTALQNARLAKDWALYKQIVNERLQAETGLTSKFERAIWSAETTEAAKVISPEEAQASRSTRVALSLHRFQRRLLIKLLQRRMPLVYGDGPIQEFQRKLLLDLGYKISFRTARS